MERKCGKDVRDAKHSLGQEEVLTHREALYLS